MCFVEFEGPLIPGQPWVEPLVEEPEPPEEDFSMPSWMLELQIRVQELFREPTPTTVSTRPMVCAAEPLPPPPPEQWLRRQRVVAPCPPPPPPEQWLRRQRVVAPGPPTPPPEQWLRRQRGGEPGP